MSLKRPIHNGLPYIFLTNYFYTSKYSVSKYFFIFQNISIYYFSWRKRSFFRTLIFRFIQKGRLYYTYFIGKMQIELCIRLAYVEGVVEMYDVTIPGVISRARKACCNGLCVFISQKVLLSQWAVPHDFYC